MLDLTLTRTKKNEIFTLIQEIGLDPSDFEWRETFSDWGEYTISVIQYKNPEFYFIFDYRDHGDYSRFSPGKQRVQNEYPGDWRGQLEYAKIWLQYLKPEIEEPDLWADIGQYQLPEVSIPFEKQENSKFSSIEQKQITNAINQLKKYLKKKLSLNENQLATLDEKMNYLIESSKKQGRRDWYFMFVGIFITLASTLGMNQELLGAIGKILKNAFAGLFKILL